MLVVAERFFCPSLELISEYLRLPPCVAGATLLSFGNGAPDVFTQLAAISQGDGDGSSPGAVAMALSEPLGSGLFVGNVVMALVIFCSGAKEVRVQQRYFLKDVLFYLAGVAAVLGFLLRGVVTLWEVALLAATYLAFMVTTILMSRGDEPVHADPRLHELPHRPAPMDSFFKESFYITDLSLPGDISVAGSESADAAIAAVLSADGDAEARLPLLPPPPAPLSPRSPLLLLPPPPRSPAAGGSGGGGAAAANRRCALTSIDEASPSASERLLLGSSPDGGSPTASNGKDAANGTNGRNGSVRRDFHLPYQPPALVVSPGDASPCGSSPRCALQPPSPPTLTAAAPPMLQRTSSDRDRGGRLGPSTWHGWGAAAAAAAAGGGAESRSWARSQSGLRRELSGRPPGRLQLLWRRLELPLLELLSLFMPRIDSEVHARYRKTYAVLLPPLLPTVLGLGQAWLGGDDGGGGDAGGGGGGATAGSPYELWRLGWWRHATAAGVAVSLLALRFWPRKGHLHGVAAGVATVIVFAEAMVLLDGSAGELVSAAVALGQIHGISPALLGATLLAWGNSVSDLVSNTTLARDGLPTMAITACFASPLFVLLAGLVTTLSYATRHGDMQLPPDVSLRVLYGAATAILTGWALAVPLLCRFRLSRRVGCAAVAAYLAFQAVYVTAVLREARGRS